jgi:hypothetical protein
MLAPSALQGRLALLGETLASAVEEELPNGVVGQQHPQAAHPLQHSQPAGRPASQRSV